MEWTLKTRLLLMRYGIAEYESKIRNTTLQYECLQHRNAKSDYKQMLNDKFWYSETWLFYIFPHIFNVDKITIWYDAMQRKRTQNHLYSE